MLKTKIKNFDDYYEISVSKKDAYIIQKNDNTSDEKKALLAICDFAYRTVKKRKNQKIIYTQMKDVFEIDEKGRLRWKIKPSYKIHIGQLIGETQTGRKKVKYQDQNLLVSRVVYCLSNKCDLDSSQFIKFRDRDPKNTTPDNLYLLKKIDRSTG